MNNIIKEYGFDDFFKKQIEELKISNDTLTVARVIEVQKEKYKIITENGEKGSKLKGSIFYNNKDILYPTVGDFVLVKPNEYGDDTIYYVLVRKSKFSRLDSNNGLEQIIAANFDYVFIMTSLNYDFNIKRIERYLSSVWQSGASPIIVLTKKDLCENYIIQIKELESVAMGVPIVVISSITGEGVDEIKEFLKPRKTSVFLGSSGVGKSSLVNLLLGQEKMLVSNIREEDSKGRHTTTYRHLFMMPDGGLVIDTPGMRELGLWNASEGVDSTFLEVDELAKKCKFKDCSHGAEPSCAVKVALDSGELLRERWDNYIKLKKESNFEFWKENASIRLKERARIKGINKFQSKFNKKSN